MEIIYDKSVVVIPKHFTLDFFEEILENARQETNARIERITIAMGSNTGDNYCSFVYRVLITYSQTTDNNESLNSKLSVIIKSTPITDTISFLEDMNVFLKEKFFYYNVLSVMEIFVNNNAKFGAKIYHSLKKPINTLVFEDLSVLGYKLASREMGLDEQHVTLVLTRLAQFHSISAVVNQKNPHLLKSFDSGILAKRTIQKDDSTFYRFIKFSCEALIDFIKTWNGYTDIVAKLENYVSELRANLLKMQALQSGEFHVLNHGDLWVNNIMFKYHNGAPIDLTFVDYQMSVWGSPGIDLNYFFYTSLPVELLKSKREYFIRIYYDELKRNLSQLHYKCIPSFEELRAEVTEREPFGFFANHAIYPIISIDKKIAGDSTFDNFANADFAKKKFKQILSQPKMTEMYTYTLRHFNEMKVFD